MANDFLSRLVTSRQPVTMATLKDKPVTDADRLVLLERQIAEKRVQAKNFFELLANTFFYRSLTDIALTQETLKFNDDITIDVGHYDIVKTDGAYDKRAWYRGEYMEVAILDNIRIEHLATFNESGLNLYENHSIVVLVDGVNIVFRYSTEWRREYATRRENIFPGKNWVFEMGDWYDTLRVAMGNFDPKNIKRAVENAKDRAKQEAARKRIQELEKKYGVSVDLDGNVLHSREEIDLERFRQDALAKLEKGEEV